MYKWMKEKDAPSRIIGINNEGPYGNRSGEKGKSRPTRPIDIQDVKNIIAASHGMIKVMSFAPELENADEMIQVLQEHNIQPAIGHSNINAEEAKAWFKKGITGLTHLGNAMTGIHHRDVGCLGASMLDENVWCELITDGKHLCNDMLTLIFKVKPNSRICLISDGAPIAGLPEGDYPSYMDPSMKVHIDKDGLILEETGRISGSGVGVIKGIKNIVENAGISLEEACRMASLNPALRYGSAAYKGSLAVGKDADFVVIDKDFNIIETVLEGRTVYKKGDKPEYNL
jgi:N-acetylglucosamine-6-phosphate deacetylase